MPRALLKAILSFIALCALSVSAAFAGDPFTVAGVYVDGRGESAIEAQTIAIGEGQLRAANLMIERVTLEGDRAAKGFAGLEIEQAVKLIRAMEIANEKRSGTRYLGDITVAFNPSAIQAYVRSKDMTMISTQTRERLVIPVITGKIAGSGHAWGAAWDKPAFGHALTPVRAGPSGERLPISGDAALAGDMDAIALAGQTVGTQQVLVANAVNSGSGITVTLTDYALDSGQTTTLGSVHGADFNAAAAAAVALLESEWKRASVNQLENAESMLVSVLYNSHSDWQRLQQAINSASQISDARLDAISKDGALMTITYGGDLGRLANELSYKGVKFETSAKLGPVLALTFSR
ncbi:MAG: DUF2066 domain-containing protein [Robiginitomaculum sp.]